MTDVTDNPRRYWNIKFLRFKDIYYPKILIAEKDKVLMECLKGVKGKYILKTDLFEEAHGNKNLLFKLSKNNRCTGMDVSTEVVRNAGNYDEKSVLIDADVTNMPFRDNKFDIIISTSTLDHLDYKSIPKAFEELHRVLKKGGVILLTIDNYHNLLYRTEFVFWKIFNLYYRTKCFKISEVVSFARNAGLRVESIETIMDFPPIIDKVFMILHQIFGINLDVVFRKVLNLSEKFNRNHPYSKGRFIFLKLAKE